MTEHREELEACRQRPEAALDAVAEQVSGAPRPGSDHVGIEFDWEVPASAGEPIIFLADIVRGDQASSIRFQLDVNKLKANELERLHDFLARFHARLTSPYELSWHLSWLVEAWLTQTQPELSPQDRHAKVRALLLCNVRSVRSVRKADTK
jgi:hypothetical protein